MANPIIHRELIGMLRTRRAFALQVLFAAALASLVLLRWPADAQVDLSGEEAVAVMRIFGYGVLAGLMILVPIFPSTTVVRERQQGTLALLLNSPMGAASILFGKIAAALGFAILLLALSLPPAAACYAMGGVSMEQLLRLYGVLGLLAVQYATMALWISTRAGSPDSALRATYGLVLFLAVVPLILVQFVDPENPMPLAFGDFLNYLAATPGRAAGEDFVWFPRAIGVPVYTVLLVAATLLTYLSHYMSPVPAMMEVLGQSDFMSHGMISAGGDLARYAVFALGSSALFAFLSWKRLAGRMLDRPRAPGTMTDDRSAGVQAYRRVMFLYFFDPQSRSGLIQPGINPVMVKEFRTRRFGRGHWMMRLIGACLVVSLGLMLAATRGTEDWGVPTLGGIMVVLQIGLIVLMTPTLASGLISSERESGGWNLLRMTPLSAVSILYGKLISVLWVLFLLLLATLPGYVIMILIDETQMLLVRNVLISLGLTMLFALLLSAAVSSLFRHTAAATATAYTILIGLIAVTMLVWVAQDAPFTRQTVETVLKVNPLATALSLIEAPGFADYVLVPANWWIMAAASGLCLVVLLVQTWRLTRAQ